MLTVGSLFAGIGGFDLGLERAGMRTVWQVELNEYRRAVLAERFPHAVRRIDVRDCGAHNLAPVDLICGGFPCQDISQAGAGAGITGTRSGLWSEFARIVGELEPRWVLVENVPALRRRGLGVVLGELAALGYDAEWDCLRACDVGAPHRRDRIWIVAYPGERGPLGARAGQRQPRRRDDVAASRPSENVADSALQRSAPNGRRRDGHLSPDPESADGWARALPSERGSRDGDSGGAARPGQPAVTPGALAEWWGTEPELGRLADGVPARVDRLAALGDSLVPQIAEWIGSRILVWERGE
jgi:DNA (cytosine-5)-methyltransferase 1